MLSPGHALALLVLHRIMCGRRITEVEMSGASLGTMLGVDAGHARNLLLDLEREGVIEKEKQIAESNAIQASRVKLTDEYRLHKPFRAKKLKHHITLPNVLFDVALRQVVRAAGGRAGLIFLILHTRAEVGVSRVKLAELMAATAASKRPVQKAVSALARERFIKRCGRSQEGTQVRLATSKPLEEGAEGGVEYAQGVMSNTRIYKDSISGERPEVHQTPTLEDAHTPTSGALEDVSVDDDIDSGSVAAFRSSSSEQTGSKSIWDGNTEPDAPEDNATELVDQLRGEKNPDAKEKTKGAKAPSSFRQKSIQALSTNKEQRAAIQSGEWHFPYLAALGTSSWSISEDFAELLVGNFEGTINPTGLVQVAGAYYERMQAESAQSAERGEYPEDYAEVQAVSIVRTIGRVVGAYQRGDVRSCPHYLVDSLERNLTGWKKIEYDAEEDYAGGNRYGLAARDIADEEARIEEAQLWAGATPEEIPEPNDHGITGEDLQDALFSEDGIPNDDIENSDNRNPDDQVEREPVGDGSQAGASETFVETSGRWSMTASGLRGSSRICRRKPSTCLLPGKSRSLASTPRIWRRV